MNVTIECVNNDQPHGDHEFELEIPEEVMRELFARRAAARDPEESA